MRFSRRTSPACRATRTRAARRAPRDSSRRRIPHGRRSEMPKYVIERDIPGAGKMSDAEIHGIAQKSCGVLSKMGPKIQWLHSYVTGDKIYCVYIAPDAATVREHAEKGGFPADRVSAVTRMIDPTTAE